MHEKSPSAETIFARAIELAPGAERDLLVNSLCAGDPMLLAELKDLLSAHDNAGEFLENKPQPVSEAAVAIPGYHIERKLGEGSLGVVFAAVEEKLNRRVAIKILRSGTNEQSRRRILDEARRAAALRDPAIVTIYSVLDELPSPAIVMELVEGFPLDRFAAQLTFHQKARLLQEVARGLSVAHAQGLIHRDLKPDNIVVGPEMRPRILDFGLAISLSELDQGFSLSTKAAFEGTPLYASPEQVLGKPLTAASDVFSFGSLMFKVLTGKVPFDGKSVPEVLENIKKGKPPFLRDVALGVPEDLQAICLACLEANPADRPTAAELAVELGRFLVNEPVRLRPKLYGDLLRRSISEYSSRAREWQAQSIISREEQDSLEVVHRRLLADEDHWLIDARRITPIQTLLSVGTWLTVVATILVVWMLRNDLGTQWRWILPAYFTGSLLAAGIIARKQRESLASATFLAGATLASAPCTLAFLAELDLLGNPAPGVKQFFEGIFTNQQVLMASGTAFSLSVFGLWKLKMTGFAWTTAALGTLSYLGLLLNLNWLEQKPEIQALWCLPLVLTEPVALLFEKRGHVRWTMPFHIVALAALVVGLDVIALQGPTLEMLGFSERSFAFFDHSRQQALSVVLNGLLFLGLMFGAERSSSLDLRRAGRFLEILAIFHIIGSLFSNAIGHRDAAFVRVDVGLYIGASVLFTALAPLRSRWRMLVGGLMGCGLGSYLLVELGLVAKTRFIVCLGFLGLVVSMGVFAYARRKMLQAGRGQKKRVSN